MFRPKMLEKTAEETNMNNYPVIGNILTVIKTIKKLIQFSIIPETITQIKNTMNNYFQISSSCPQREIILYNIFIQYIPLNLFRKIKFATISKNIVGKKKKTPPRYPNL